MADTNPLERRYLPLTGVQIETRGGVPTEIRGYSAVFNSVADIGFWKEVVIPGAFKRTIQENNNDIAALVDHDPARVLARITNQRLELREDGHGLDMRAKPTDTSYARDLMTNIAERNVTKQSFGFVVPPGGDQWRTVDGVEQRELIDVELYDVSPVTYPAYQATSVTVRSQAQEAGLDVQGLSSAFVRHLRGLDLSKADRDILTQAVTKLPILQRGAEGQALPGSEAKPTPSQAWRVSLLRRRFRLAARAA